MPSFNLALHLHVLVFFISLRIAVVDRLAVKHPLFGGVYNS